MIKYLENENDFAKIIANDLVLVDFYADWCGPCKMLSQVLEQVTTINILKVNVDNFPDIAKNYQVMSIPTLIIFKKGEEKSKKIGFVSQSQLNDWLEENL